MRGAKPEDALAARERLAETLLREDPAAFREMVFAGLRALERAGASPAEGEGGASGVGARHAVPAPSPNPAQPESQVANHAAAAQYAAFEKAANEDLEREVGGAIERTLERALPAAAANGAAQPGGATARARLSGAIRADIESALKSDRQLGEQIAQLLAARSFDEATRGQVVRLIGERARQLVPGAARRVLNDWTQTALAGHRARAERPQNAAARTEAPAADSSTQLPGPASGQDRRTTPRKAREGNRPAPVDYRRMSDEQILEL